MVALRVISNPEAKLSSKKKINSFYLWLKWNIIFKRWTYHCWVDFVDGCRLDKKMNKINKITLTNDGSWISFFTINALPSRFGCTAKNKKQQINISNHLIAIYIKNVFYCLEKKSLKQSTTSWIHSNLSTLL